MNAEERAILLTGGTAADLNQSLDQWENEREALAQLYDENQALLISFRRYDLVMILAEKIINGLELDAAMFITQKSRDKIQQFREQLKLLQNSRIQDRYIKELSNDRTRSNS